MYSFLSSPVTSYSNLPQQISIMNYSVLKELDCKVPFKRFSIKYVIAGEETYFVNGKRYAIKSDEYLIANQFAEGSVIIDSKTPVKGLCIDIAPNLIEEAVASFIRPDTFFPDNNLSAFFNTETCLENQYQAKNTIVGHDLIELSNAYADQPELPRVIPDAVFYNIAEHFVADHIGLYRQLQQIPAIKQQTKKELMRRLQTAKAFMDEHFLALPTIKHIATYCNLSEFHFFRLYKKVYGESPYHYMLKKRMEFAAGLLKDPNINVTDVASMAGFADVYSFSKAFKKYFRVAPSQFSIG